MKKQTFLSTIDALKCQHNRNVEFAQNMGKCFPSAFEANLLPPCDDLQMLVIGLLSEITGDTDGLIEWWVYDKDFGRNDLALYQNGVEIDVSDAGKLYDFLTQTKL